MRIKPEANCRTERQGKMPRSKASNSTLNRGRDGIERRRLGDYPDKRLCRGPITLFLAFLFEVERGPGRWMR